MVASDTYTFSLSPVLKERRRKTSHNCEDGEKKIYYVSTHTHTHTREKMFKCRQTDHQDRASEASASTSAAAVAAVASAVAAAALAAEACCRHKACCGRNH
jgi:hypothetical protein